MTVGEVMCHRFHGFWEGVVTLVSVVGYSVYEKSYNTDVEVAIIDVGCAATSDAVENCMVLHVGSEIDDRSDIAYLE
jgi:hypothetical protein